MANFDLQRTPVTLNGHFRSSKIWDFLGAFYVKLPTPNGNILKKITKCMELTSFLTLTVDSNDEEKRSKFEEMFIFLVLIYCDSVVIDNILILTVCFN